MAWMIILRLSISFAIAGFAGGGWSRSDWGIMSFDVEAEFPIRWEFEYVSRSSADIVFQLLWCLFSKLDIIELVVVAIIKVIPHSFIRLKASLIFARFGSAVEAIPNVSVTVRYPQAMRSCEILANARQ
jgi:hypothetical protein